MSKPGEATSCWSPDGLGRDEEKEVAGGCFNLHWPSRRTAQILKICWGAGDLARVVTMTAPNGREREDALCDVVEGDPIAGVAGTT